jgi:hypothetical protein
MDMMKGHVIKRYLGPPKAFEDLKEAVTSCQKLFFLDRTSDVFLQTDASDYGIGSYLFQKMDNAAHHPVMFISKTLTSVQVRWSVPEKEAYAIHYALNKMEYLLRDIKFIIETDHENLTRIYSSGSPKVLRWKLELQSYNADIRYIKGEENGLAEAMSCLCKLPQILTPIFPNIKSWRQSMSCWGLRSMQ